MIDKIISATVLRIIPAFITPNHITAFRFASIPFVIYLIAVGQTVYGIILFVISASSDAVDGALARTRGPITEWGKLYDPVADKLLIGSVAALTVSRYLSHTLALSIIILEILIVAMAFYRRRFRGRDISAKPVGKMKMILQSVGIGFVLLYAVSPNPVLLLFGQYLLYGAIVFALLSLFVYRSI